MVIMELIAVHQLGQLLGYLHDLWIEITMQESNYAF